MSEWSSATLMPISVWFFTGVWCYAIAILAPDYLCTSPD